VNGESQKKSKEAEERNFRSRNVLLRWEEEARDNTPFHSVISSRLRLLHVLTRTPPRIAPMAAPFFKDTTWHATLAVRPLEPFPFPRRPC